MTIFIDKPQEQDVLFGHGGWLNVHTGNIWYRQLVQQHCQDYHAAQKYRKKNIAEAIVQAIQKQLGRFLAQLQPKSKKNNKHNHHNHHNNDNDNDNDHNKDQSKEKDCGWIEVPYPQAVQKTS